MEERNKSGRLQCIPYFGNAAVQTITAEKLHVSTILPQTRIPAWISTSVGVNVAKQHMVEIRKEPLKRTRHPRCGFFSKSNFIYKYLGLLLKHMGGCIFFFFFLIKFITVAEALK